MKTPYIILYLPLFLALNAIAQEPIKQSASPPVESYIYTPKIISLEYESSFSHRRNYESTQADDIAASMDLGHKISASVLIPIIPQKKGWSVVSNFQYDHFYMPVNQLLLNEQSISIDERKNSSTSYLTMIVAKDLSFKKRKIALSSIFSMIGSVPHKPKKFGGILSIAMPLKNTATTSLNIGISYIFNKHNVFPILPTIVYAQQWNKRWNLEMILPSFVQIRRIVAPNFFMLSGVRLGQSLPHIETQANLRNLAEVLELRDTELRLFGALEKAINGAIWLGVELGYNRQIDSLLTEPENTNEEYFLKGKGAGNFYGKVGVFYRPIF